jgi:hypothetical protein
MLMMAMGNETFDDGGYLSEESNLINMEMEEFQDLEGFSGWCADVKRESSFETQSSGQLSYDSFLPPIQTVLPTHFPNTINYPSDGFDQIIRSSPTSLHLSSQVCSNRDFKFIY